MLVHFVTCLAYVQNGVFQKTLSEKDGLPLFIGRFNEKCWAIPAKCNTGPLRRSIKKNIIMVKDDRKDLIQMN